MDKDLEIKRLQNHLEGLISCINSSLHFDDQDVVSKSMILAYEHVLCYMKSHDLV